MRTALALLAAVCLLAGCGVRPTGVRAGGPPAAGIPEGFRVYFASDQGLRGVARPEVEVKDLAAVLKIIMQGPNEAEQASGLTNLVSITGTMAAEATGGQVTLRLPQTPVGGMHGLAAGQLVCTLSRAESRLHGTHPDAVRVTVVAKGGTAGPYQCPQFLG